MTTPTNKMATKPQVTGETSPPTLCPPPWSTRNEAYWLLLWLSSPLPADIYDPLEASHTACTTTGFKGGLGMIQIVRYTDTPVGAYDELLIIPGNFDVPGGSQKGKGRMRITRIYVSQQETTFNGRWNPIRAEAIPDKLTGRKNWNIAKHLARFEFSAPSVAKGETTPKELTVSVFPPRSSTPQADVPFFKATLTPMRFLPTFPLSTKWMPLNTTLVQPPIPAAEDGLLCGTEVWRMFEVVATTREAKLTWVKVTGEESVAREGYWPDVKPFNVGVWLENASLDIPVPEEWEQ